MSTRAVYTFKGFDEEYHVYKHHDGYPTGAATWLGNAFGYAWGLPRYEPDDFAAAFVAGNKSGGGGVRLMHSRYQAGDVEFGYTVYPLDNQSRSAFPQLKAGTLMVEVASTDYWGDTPTETLIFKGPLSDFLVNAAAIEERYNES